MENKDLNCSLFQTSREKQNQPTARSRIALLRTKSFPRPEPGKFLTHLGLEFLLLKRSKISSAHDLFSCRSVPVLLAALRA
jgi:hypothetical protein